MPELPEVETIARKLNDVLPGKRIEQITLLHPKPWQGIQPSELVGYEITQVSRRAKIIRIHLIKAQTSETVNILIHLKMTGQLIYLDANQRLGGGHPTADWVSELPSKHTRVQFDLSARAKLFFNDQRLFGWLRAMNDEAVETALKDLAPDVIDSSVTVEYLQPILGRRSQAIKQVIMDTTVMCGVGNIYACDALNLAQIHPERPAKSLTPTEVERLLKSAKQVINQGIELGGTTFDGKYVDIDGMAGQYQSVVRVYGREGKECLHCQGQIAKSKLGGRGTYYCVKCQV
jgi:formamidopyrimidine-DNA glycosylase